MVKSKPPYNVNSQIRSALRKVWQWSPMRRDALARGRMSRGVYKCSKCSMFITRDQVEVDHIIPATPPEGITKPSDWGLFIERLLFCPPSNLVAMCKPCHKRKTSEDRQKSKEAKSSPKRPSKRKRGKR